MATDENLKPALLYAREPDLKSKQDVVILNLQGDLFDTALIAKGEEGGKTASAELHRLVLEEMAKETPEAVDVAVYLVAHDETEGEAVFSDSDESDSGPAEPTRYERFLDGFKASPRLSMIAKPTDAHLGDMLRVLQLLWFHLPTATRVFPGSLHRNFGAIYIENLDEHSRAKITLVETVVVAPAMRRLVDSGKYGSTSTFKALFSDMTHSEGLGIPLSKYLVLPDVTAERTDEEHALSAAMSSVALEPDFNPPRQLRFKKPHPSQHFYLSPHGCLWGDECRFSHSYSFQPWEWEAFALYTKANVCVNLANAGMCRWGD